MNGYLKRNWLGAEGYDSDTKTRNYLKGDNINGSLGLCDDYRCRLSIEGVKVSIIHNSLSIRMACEDSNIVITKTPMPRDYCDDVHVVDRFDVWRHGATTITFSNGRYDVRMVK